MAIDPMVKTKVMRPSLIDAVDKINELVSAVNALDPGSIDTRVTALETWQGSTNTRLDNMSGDITAAQGDIDAAETDITMIKTTLYTPLSDGGM